MKYSLWATLVVCSIATLILGPTSLETVWQGVLERFSGTSDSWNPLLDERLPRLLVLIATGASLSVAGGVMQSLFQNPLASPGVLGMTAGSSLSILIVLITGCHIIYPFAIPIAAIGGCLLTIMIIWSLSRCHGMYHLILTGIALSTTLIAIHGVIVYALRDQWQLMQTIAEWEAGSTLDRTWQHAHMQLPLTIIGLIGCWRYRREINILALGDEDACNLGVDVDTVRWRLFICVALLIGGAMAAVGVIAFFGLVLPHVIRRLQGPDNIRLIPLCAIAGATVLVLLDNILRFFTIHWLSIGNLSAALGGIFFLGLLVQQLRQGATYA